MILSMDESIKLRAFAAYIEMWESDVLAAKALFDLPLPITIAESNCMKASYAGKRFEEIGCEVKIEYGPGETIYDADHDAFGTVNHGESYSIMGASLEFDASAMRLFDLQHFLRETQATIASCFKSWYNKYFKIDSMLRDYQNYAAAIIRDYAINPLFVQLPKYEIFDVSESNYSSRCFSMKNSDEAFKAISGRYEAIIREKQAEQEYRAIRKESRSRWQGGGFGLGGAIEGAAKAAALNAVSGLGHSVVNAAGNAVSAATAHSRLTSLFMNEKTIQTLLNGINNDITEVVNAHINLINEHIPNCITASFNYERASALLENAQKVSEKRRELILQAIALCPWHHDLLKYIFVEYPEDRSETFSLGNRFHVDLKNDIEAVIEKEYGEADRCTEESALAAKQRIKAIMAQYGVEESETLNRLDSDCLRHMLQSRKLDTIEMCDEFVDLINKYDAQDHVKAVYLQEVEKQKERIWTGHLDEICDGCEKADESHCKEMKSKVDSYTAPETIKKKYLDRLQTRIESIWSAEDGEVFDNIYLETDLYNPETISASIEYIKSKARTASSEKYLKALRNCTNRKLSFAQFYNQPNKRRMLLIVSIAGIVLDLVCEELLYYGSGMVGALALFAGIAGIVLYFAMRSAWKRLTINGTIIHPAITNTPAKKSRKGKKT